MSVLSDADLQGMFDAARDADYEDVAREASVLAESDFVPEIEKCVDCASGWTKSAGSISSVRTVKQAAEAAINRAKGR